MEDLQRKIRAYETQGVQATLDMQRAARSVALENARLRSLLTSKGVSEDEVEKYLASPGEGQSRQKEGTERGFCPEKRPEGPEVVTRDTTPNSPASTSSTATDAGALMCLKRLVNEDGPHPFGSLETQLESSPNRTLSTDSRARLETPDSAASTPDAEQITLPSLRMMSLSPYEMSCSTTAEIIAGSHGHDDSSMARAAIDCTGASHCVIRNTQVIEVLQNS